MWCATLLRVLWATFLLLTSFYSLLAYLPYTYCAFIKAPPYAWIPWFAQHHATLWWWSLVAIASDCFLRNSLRSHRFFLASLGLAGLFLTLRPFLPTLQDNQQAYCWGLGCLLPILGLSILDLVEFVPRIPEQSHKSLFSYSTGIMVGVITALLFSGGAVYQKVLLDPTTPIRPSFELELLTWSLVSHVVVAIIVLSVLNVIWLLAFGSQRPNRLKIVLLGTLCFVGLWMALLGLLEETFSFDGWQAYLYAAVLSGTLTSFAASVAVCFMGHQRVQSQERNIDKAFLAGVCVVISLLALGLPGVLGGGDWNGIMQRSFTVAFWMVLSLCFYSLRQKSRRYSAVAVIAVLLFSLVAYKGMQASEILWARSLGATDDDIASSLETYGNSNPSFQLVHHLLSNSTTIPCGDLCRIMREYTNIRNAQAKADLSLVDRLTPSAGEHPNIFIFVIDSMRPDYIGAYNPKVDFTPNLDSLARDSIVLRNAYTQYAGTSLSEPAIWSGALLLHAHFLQPFGKVNSLAKLAAIDNYQTVVSYDTVLAQLFPPSSRILKLDTDKRMWNNFEVCSTVNQTEEAIDKRLDPDRPILFYAQPMNVHQFARNNNPMPNSTNWRARTGFNYRVAYEVHQVDECLGHFVKFLKSRNLYEKSIIIVTSDHGDATGELGRRSHSVWIYPEIMHVPLIIHLPPQIRQSLVYDDSQISALTDITPTLYYVLGHRPIIHNPLFGRPLFTETKEELESCRRNDLFMASDVRADYGILGDNGRWLYVAYDSPQESMLFDLRNDPTAQHNVLTAEAKKKYDEAIIGHLQAIADFYGYTPQVRSWLSSQQ